jgi:hypothetical protein
MSAKKATQKANKSTTATGKKSKGFTDDEGARPRAKSGSAPRPARELGKGWRGERRAREPRDSGAC